MILMTHEQFRALRANAQTPDADPFPVLKLFNPAGPATWIATELAADGDTLFGLADMGFGCPELGYFSLREISAIHLPFGLRIERDRAFSTAHPLSAWASEARRCGSLLAAELALACLDAQALPDPEIPPRS